jgi:lysophospholipase L1-like esterase
VTSPSPARSLAALALVLAAAATVTGCVSAPATPSASTSGTPAAAVAPIIDSVDSVLVLGDSITLGVNACDTDRICSDASWATGTDPGVDSLLTRARAQNPSIEVEALARDGARIGTAVSALAEVAAVDADLIVLLLGANDACARDIEGMTPAAAYRDQLGQVLTTLSNTPAQPAILVLSIPDMRSVWESEHDDPDAVRMWNSSPACRSLLGDPEATTSAANDRRERVALRVEEFNTAIVEVCGAIPRCGTDAGALHEHDFDSEEISPIDHFHPSALGQQRIAAIAWAALVEFGSP